LCAHVECAAVNFNHIANHFSDSVFFVLVQVAGPVDVETVDGFILGIVIVA
jgi:hypothetical protein